MSPENMRKAFGAEPRVRLFPDAKSASLAVAHEIVELVEVGGDSGRGAVLGLATGRTPLLVYRELKDRHRAGLSFATVTSFNLDEFVGVSPQDPNSFRSTMQRELFDDLDLLDANVHVPRGDVAPGHEADACSDYEDAIRAAGGIDLQLLGMASNGHVGFNEPGSGADTHTRQVALAESTRIAYGPVFPGGRAPAYGVTVGIATIRAARRLRLLAFGVEKAEAVRRLVQDEPDPGCPASLLRGHPDFVLLLDPEAASRL